MNKLHGVKLISALLAALLAGTALPCPPAEAAATRLDPAHACSLTVTTPDDMPGLKEIDFTADVWRVASVDDNVSYTLTEPFDALQFQGYTLKGTDINRYKKDAGETTDLAKVDELARALYERATGRKYDDEEPQAEEPATQGLTPDAQITVSEGTGTADKTTAGTSLLPGYYLIVPEDCSDGEYVYRFGPTLVAIPYLGTDPAVGYEDWLYAVTAHLKPEKEACKGNVKIVKNLHGYNETLEGATFLFSVSATKDGVLVYSNVISLRFDDQLLGGHAVSKEYMISGLPVGAEVEVEEVYSGSCYELTGSSVTPQDRLVIAFDEDAEDPQVLTFTFDNAPDDHVPHGTSVLNHYEMATGTYGHTGLEDSTQEPSQKK